MTHTHRAQAFSVSLLLATVLMACERQGNQQAQPAGQAQTADTGSIAAGAFRLRYRIEGTGIPTLVIGSSVYYPRAFSQDLRQHLRMVFLDHRGFAPSPGPVALTAFALDTLVDDMERARQELRLGRIAVVGHSGHAFMALEYAKKYPANVSHVIMIAIAPDLGAANTRAMEQHWEEFASLQRKAILDEQRRRLPDPQLAALVPSEAFIKGYIRNAPRIWYDPHFDSSALWAGVEINMGMFNHVWGRIFADIDIERGLAVLDRPVFLALGRYDFLIAPPSTWDPIQPRFRDLTVRVFEKSGHTPQYEEAELFDQELLRWISLRK